MENLPPARPNAPQAVSPLDGKYKDQLTVYAEIAPGEEVLILKKVQLEFQWLCFVSATLHGRDPDIREIPKATEFADAETIVRLVREIDSRVQHDTKAVELLVRKLLLDSTSPWREEVELVHIGLTSEDLTGTAYSLSLLDVFEGFRIQLGSRLHERLNALIRENADAVMTSLTHGQAASPTTFGKELSVFLRRLHGLLKQVGRPPSVPIKWGGAVGTLAALQVLDPSRDWLRLCRVFVEQYIDPSRKLSYDFCTTQLANREWISEQLHLLIRINCILLDLCRDQWLYCSRGLLTLQIKKDEVGSSTMPHKVNPIHFENAEGNLEMANTQLDYLAQKLLVSRMQRDLSDSTVMRTLSGALGHAWLAWQNIEKGLCRIAFDRQAAFEDLSKHWELLAEPIQTVFRTYNIGDAYGVLKSAARTGRPMTQEDVHKVLDQYKETLSVYDYERLKQLRPETYTGYAETIALAILDEFQGPL